MEDTLRKRKWRCHDKELGDPRALRDVGGMRGREWKWERGGGSWSWGGENGIWAWIFRESLAFSSRASNRLVAVVASFRNREHARFDILPDGFRRRERSEVVGFWLLRVNNFGPTGVLGPPYPWGGVGRDPELEKSAGKFELSRRRTIWRRQHDAGKQQVKYQFTPTHSTFSNFAKAYW